MKVKWSSVATATKGPTPDDDAMLYIVLLLYKLQSERKTKKSTLNCNKNNMKNTPYAVALVLQSFMKGRFLLN